LLFCANALAVATADMFVLTTVIISLPLQKQLHRKKRPSLLSVHHLMSKSLT